MRAIESSARDPSALLADTIVQTPQDLLPDLLIVETSVDLGTGHGIDVLGVTSDERPVIVVIGDGDEAAALQRVLGTLQEVRDRANLLNRAFRGSGVNWSKPPHAILLNPRISDDLARLVSDLLGHLSISCREYVLADRDGTRQAWLVRSGLATVRPSPAVATVSHTPVLNGGRRGRQNGSVPARREASRPEPQPMSEAKVPLEREEHGARHLFLEAKKKILRIGDNIEEEVDGDEVRFRVKEGVLAVLSLANDELKARCDDPDPVKALKSASELDAFLNETFRRYLSLAGRGELTFPVGHPLDRERASA